MTQDELIELLNAHEWRDVEFKEAQRAVPRNAYETVSAFANTEGGHLVFGVKTSAYNSPTNRQEYSHLAAGNRQSRFRRSRP